MDTINLRVLTHRSHLNFGRYRELSVQQIINLDHKQYLRWVYFNIRGISFNDELLDELGIPDDFRIIKPGIDAEKWDILRDRIIESCKGLTNIISKKRTRKTKMRDYVNNIKRDKIYYSNSSLQRSNHGHKKLR